MASRIVLISPRSSSSSSTTSLMNMMNRERTTTLRSLSSSSLLTIHNSNNKMISRINRIHFQPMMMMNNVRKNSVVITKTQAAEVVPPQLSKNGDNINNIVLQQQEEAVEVNSTNTAINPLLDLTITNSCYKRITSLAARRNDAELKDLYLRVYVDAGGCSGFQYKFELTLEMDEAVSPQEDIVYQSNKGDARVVVDRASLELIAGSTIDFVQEMIKSSFAVIENPQSESACGCGSSFAVKNFAANPAMD